MKSIYTRYKERLIEISGRNRSLYLKTFNKKNGYDIGKLLFSGPDKAAAFLDWAWNLKTTNFKLISKETTDVILKGSDIDIRYPELPIEATPSEKAKRTKQRNNYTKRIIAQEVRNINALKKEIEDIQKETGRYELFLCYPFVYGSIKNFTFKAPLLLFPVKIEPVDDYNVNISLIEGENVQLNKALLLAIAEANHLSLDELETEFSNLPMRFSDVNAVLEYLRSFGVRISLQPRKNIFPFDRYDEPEENSGLEIKYLCLLARCSLANSIYSDYSLLEKRALTNNSIGELLNTKPTKISKPKNTPLYLINDVDFAQREVISKVNDDGNMVIYGPPGTGKSQTIVNVIADSICKNKRVLVISQKKAALEVIYNRLASLSTKSIFITDAIKERKDFYTHCYATHETILKSTKNEKLQQEFAEQEVKLNKELADLEALSACLNTKTDYGISLQEMYYTSHKFKEATIDYQIYQEMLKNSNLLTLTYQRLKNALDLLNDKNTAELYYNFIKNSVKNPFIQYLNKNLTLSEITQINNKLDECINDNLVLLDTAKYKYSRQIIAYIADFNNHKNMKPLISLLVKLDNSPINIFAKKKSIKNDVENTLNYLNSYIEKFGFLRQALNNDGYMMALDSILHANNTIFKLLKSAFNNYIEWRDINNIIHNLTADQKLILEFAYDNSTTPLSFTTILKKLLNIRTYHEIVKYEDANKLTLSKIVDFENIRIRIVQCRKHLNELSRDIANQSFSEEYKNMIDGSIESKDYLYQISKKQKQWPVRKVMEQYGKYLFKLFPCWLLSPENVSSLLPLTKNMFDIVIFDEASQIFIENSIPSIYRGKNIIVSGDSKQLRPTTTFMRRYMGNNDDDEMLDSSTQAALEVESLLDLAVSRFNSANITYHYRSQNQELIDFSNKAFYENKLQIAPNISKNIRHKPIERIMVDGLWEDGKNLIEAQKIVELLKKIIKTRKHNETLGVITFNSEQEALINNLIDKTCKTDPEFRRLYLAEFNRTEDGQDVGVFVKNLENVQGDERDIIIFSVGYAKNEFNKVNFIFGTLSYEGGENRLNVAITRAKKKIYVVTSIEPEELKVDNSKSLGPKLLRSYLTYVRAVSNNNSEEIKTILDSFGHDKFKQNSQIADGIVEKQIADRLNKLGYNTELSLGNSNVKISVAVYDKRHDRFVLGIETDQEVVSSSNSALERDVYRNEFLKSKGWFVYRVWSRDWWHDPNKVINEIEKEIKKQQKLLLQPSKPKVLPKAEQITFNINAEQEQILKKYRRV